MYNRGNKTFSLHSSRCGTREGREFHTHAQTDALLQYSKPLVSGHEHVFSSSDASQYYTPVDHASL